MAPAPSKWLSDASVVEPEGTEIWLFHLPASVNLSDLNGTELRVKKKKKKQQKDGEDEEDDVVARINAGGGDEFPGTEPIVVREWGADPTARCLVGVEGGTRARLSTTKVSKVLSVGYEPRASVYGEASFNIDKHPPAFLTEAEYSIAEEISDELRGPRLKETSFGKTAIQSRAAYRGRPQLENMRVRFRPNGASRGELGGLPRPDEEQATKGEKKKKKKKSEDNAESPKKKKQTDEEEEEDEDEGKKKKRPKPTSEQPTTPASSEPPKKKKKKKKSSD